jgi:L-arabinose isomerase
MKLPNRKPLIGLLFISPPRFRNLGEGTEHGFYYERKEREAASLLQSFDFADIVFPGVVYTREDMDQAVARFTNESVDMIFAHFLSWSDDFAWIRFLRDMGTMPILFATISRDEPGFEDSLTEDRFIEFLSAGGLVGALEASGSVGRFNRPMMRTVIGSRSEVMTTARQMAQAAKIRTQLRKTSFGLLPSYNEAMWSTYVDPYDLFMKVGPELHFLTVAGLEDEIAQIPKAQVEAVMDEVLARFPTDGEILRDKFYASVEASIGLEIQSRNAGIELLVLNDIDQVLMRHIGLRPGFTPCSDDATVMVVPEGDIGGGLACYILHKLSEKDVNFVEPFHIDKRTGLFAAGHAGPNNYRNPEGKTKIAKDARFARSNFKHAGAPFAWHVIGAGPKTMLHVSQQANGRFKMVCTTVEAVETPHFLAGYSHGLFRSPIPVEEFFGRLIQIGVTQHYGVVSGDYTAEAEMLASLLDFDYHRI